MRPVELVAIEGFEGFRHLATAQETVSDQRALLLPALRDLPDLQAEEVREDFEAELVGRRGGVPALVGDYLYVVAGVGQHLFEDDPPGHVRAHLGYSSIRVTMDVYGHLYEDTKDEIADRLQRHHSRQSGSPAIEIAPSRRHETRTAAARRPDE